MPEKAITAMNKRELALEVRKLREHRKQTRAEILALESSLRNLREHHEALQRDYDNTRKKMVEIDESKDEFEQKVREPLLKELAGVTQRLNKNNEKEAIRETAREDLVCAIIQSLINN